jgi:hypothetical protein
MGDKRRIAGWPVDKSSLVRHESADHFLEGEPNEPAELEMKDFTLMEDNASFAIVGTAGAVASLSLTQINAVLGCIAAVLTIIYVCLGILIRWKNRNKGDE